MSGTTGYSTTPGSNQTVDGVAYWVEGMDPDKVNDVGRQMMADIATTLNPAATLANGATDANTASTIVKRDDSGNFKASDGVADSDVATYGQVSSVSDDLTTHTDNTTDAHGADDANTAGAIVRRNNDGNASVGTPTASAHIANKSYVDDQISDLTYTGSSASNATFPVGTILNIRLSGTIPDRNEAVTVYLSTARSYEFTMNAADSAGQLTGTWRSRGYGDDYLLVQRTA